MRRHGAMQSGRGAVGGGGDVGVGRIVGSRRGAPFVRLVTRRAVIDVGSVAGIVTRADRVSILVAHANPHPSPSESRNPEEVGALGGVRPRGLDVRTSAKFNLATNILHLASSDSA